MVAAVQWPLELLESRKIFWKIESRAPKVSSKASPWSSIHIRRALGVCCQPFLYLGDVWVTRCFKYEDENYHFLPLRNNETHPPDDLPQ